MSSLQNQQFNSFHLDNIMSRTAPNFIAFQEALNGISSDIKKLEKFYQDAGICIPFECPVEETPESHGVVDVNVEDFRSHGLKNSLVVAWDEFEEQGFRLLLIERREHGVFHQDNSMFGFHEHDHKVESLSRKPLIEAKAGLRIRVHKGLPKFHEAFCEVVGEAIETMYDPYFKNEGEPGIRGKIGEILKASAEEASS
ncbi:MAG: hypothetical protein JST16_18375 [Bdellovibrionales bacterium]|nr:hypothetical protein [Bdellovibrionales bacterium]